MPLVRKAKLVSATMPLALLMGAAAVHAEGSPDLELYVDTQTKQIYAEPGPNRVSVGTYRRVDPAATAAAPKPAAAAEAPAAASAPAPAATQHASSGASASSSSKKKWYDLLSLRGYTQFRYNEVMSGDRDIRLWSDPGVGENRNMTIRRARLIISGDVGEHLSLYLQPDFSSSTADGSTGNVAQLRDVYGDIFFDKAKNFRVRVGQSKIPYSFENLQSSQNRLSLDRNDALNSCCRDERDLGAFFYWEPTEKRELFRALVANGLKGSGDYGVFALGVYNGQGSNRTEANDNMHLVTRFTWPHKFANGQIVEAGIQAYRGRYLPINTATGGTASLATRDYKDKRLGLHAVWYPQPFGLQSEWNWGTGPQLNANRTAINEEHLNGGYVQAMYKQDKVFGHGTVIPFVKWQYFDGAIKSQTNAPYTKVRDWELGVEWQPFPEVELTTVYHLMNRNNVTASPYAAFNSDVLRVQVQINY